MLSETSFQFDRPAPVGAPTVSPAAAPVSSDTAV